MSASEVAPGHVFITRGDLTRLSCDAWLLPSDGQPHVVSAWLRWRPDLAEFVQPDGTFGIDLPDDWDPRGTRTVRVPGDARLPTPWLTMVGARSGTERAWYLEAASQFLERASADLQDVQPRSDRARHLLALPIIGTGFGGAHDIAGGILMDLLSPLHEFARTSGVDVALVTNSPMGFAAAQRARRRLVDERSDGVIGSWWSFDSRLEPRARQLAAYARDRRLVLFIGAGVSTGAGLPTWRALLERLEERAGFDTDERRELARLDGMDRARMVQLRMAEQGQQLGDQVAEEMQSPCYSLGHSLLASLPVDEVVTTNYDTLFEAASEDADRPARVLPYDPWSDKDRWLLKLHGSIDQRDDIVLTRADYLRYVDRRAALAGIVQALLITRHMLFVGFSLSDDNFHRIVDEVRKAVHGDTDIAAQGTRFGTSLHLLENPLLEQLWANDLDAIAIAPAATDEHVAARDLDLLLDFLLAEATDNRAHVLDENYADALTPEELEIQRVLQKLSSHVGASTKQSDAWQPIARLLRDFGGE